MKKFTKITVLAVVISFLLNTSGLAAIRINQWVPPAPYDTSTGSSYTN